ncbi:hypothetical protein [Agromyces mediolanus]|uniref:hypothetical protein n=1 Tax=Agromyces mediolanus TaxID=41986 RepID=UPI001E5330DF|nr:hypothetical protein [Agromyces mediolanus]MCD1570484.1 hypothetical protein [Agromyces mediolanus]
MPRTRRTVAAAAAVAFGLVAALAGCDAGPVDPTSSSPPSPAPPIFASDEEALAAAEAAYAAYAAADAAILADGGKGSDRIKEHVSATYEPTVLKAYAQIAEGGLVVRGEGSIEGARLIEANREVVQIYACLDVGGTVVLNAEGADVTPPERPLRTPMLLRFVPDEDRLLLDGSEKWDGDDFC